jgi:hypothetical protein
VTLIGSAGTAWGWPEIAGLVSRIAFSNASIVAVIHSMSAYPKAICTVPERM